MSADSIQRVAVLGLGTMGHGIAQVFAQAGHEVCGFDSDASARGALHNRIRGNLDDFLAAGMVAPDAVDATLGQVTVAASEAAAVADAQLVVEAVAEDLPTKQELLKRVECVVSETTILASNSSTFPISQSAIRMRRPERALVTHWFNPPHIVPTVEIVPGPETSAATVDTMVELHRSVGKLPVRLNRELPGFLVNRVQMALIREVWDLLDQGVASPEDIDAAIRGSIGFRLAVLGPLEVCDFGGLEIWRAVYRNLIPEIRSDTALPEAIDRLVEAGHLGAKTGKGIYDYDTSSSGTERSDRDARMLALARLFYGGRA